MKRIAALLCTAAFVAAIAAPCVAVETADTPPPAKAAFPAGPSLAAPSAILIERDSGTVLTEKNADARLAPASVTKVMTLLLTMEAIDSGQITKDSVLTVSQNAMDMGGSTAYLGAGEKYSVHDMLKAVAIQSANDAAIALAEFLSGSESAFVDRMNIRARELGMTNTQFKNCHGLDADGHYTSSRDIALMSRELLLHPDIRNYTTIWMDSLRDGTFQLANTNRLVRFYPGATGLKTGSTSKAGCCISASAERDGMELIAVIMNADNTDDRFNGARALLDFGFATFTAIKAYPDQVPVPVPVRLGEVKEIQPVIENERGIVVEKSKAGAITRDITLSQKVTAPIIKGQRLGELTLSLDGKPLITVPLVAAEDVKRLSFGMVLGRLLKTLVFGRV
ncbi:MAG: D-alanyl-D-alanine carboxypeptidase [Oscillospiraceae bacterium]|jgi:D-alanyl-D-alanine carboxypeptidase (penicillin-binding protein 5/6)|nr:D-alanyl-D-alanine carboxypeptidase [Oscillospiraceae bacterium]